MSEHKCLKEDEIKRIWEDIKTSETRTEELNKVIGDFDRQHMKTTFAVQNIQTEQVNAKMAQNDLVVLIKDGFKIIEDKHREEANEAKAVKLLVDSETKATKAADKDYRRKFIYGLWFVGINMAVSTMIGLWRIYIFPWLSGQ